MITPPPQSPVERSMTIPPPVMGWTTSQPVSEMNPLFSPEILNFFPAQGSVELRKGYRYYSSGIGSNQVFTIAPLETQSVSKLIAVGSNLKVYDASTASAAATDISGGVTFNAGVCMTMQFRDRIFIKSVHNSDDVYHWTGTGNIVASAFTGPSGDDKKISAMCVYRGRVFFAQSDAPSIWYAPLNAVTGAMTELSLSSIFQLPFQSIYFIGPAVRAKEYAEDEMFVIATNSGEILLYQGDYPGDSTWRLVGRYFVPQLIGPRACFYAGSSLHISTRLGVIRLMDLLQGGYDGTWPMISAEIESAFADFFTDTTIDIVAGPGYIQGGIAYPKGKYLLINAYDGFSSFQFVQNLNTKAWTKFAGQDAFHWNIWQGNLYFGGLSGKVFKADNGFFDEDPANTGDMLARTIRIRHAFNSMGSPTVRKKFVSATPTVYQSENLSITLNCDVDYTDTVATSTETDTSLGTSYQLYQPKCGLSAPSGNAVSIRIDGSVIEKRISLQATKVVWEEGTAF